MSKRIYKALMVSIFSGIAATTFAGAAIAQPTPLPNTNRTFSEWCEEKSTLPVPARRTVEAAMMVVDTNDCTEAEIRLTNLSELNLEQAQLSDLRPLTALPQLNILKLSGNNISDISPLASSTISPT